MTLIPIFYVQENKVKEADQKVMRKERKRKSDEISMTWIVSKCDTFFITGNLPEIAYEHFQAEKSGKEFKRFDSNVNSSNEICNTKYCLISKQPLR